MHSDLDLGSGSRSTLLVGSRNTSDLKIRSPHSDLKSDIGLYDPCNTEYIFEWYEQLLCCTLPQDQEDKKKEDYRVPTGNLLFRRTGVANCLGHPVFFFFVFILVLRLPKAEFTSKKSTVQVDSRWRRKAHGVVSTMTFLFFWCLFSNRCKGLSNILKN